MRKHHGHVVAQLILSSAFLWTVGCGDDTKKTVKDGGTDVAVVLDTNRPDLTLAPDTKLDTATTPDVPLVDAASPDMAAQDGATTDGMDDAMVGTDAVGETLASITFRFKNTGTQAVYLHRQCDLPIQVTAEADGATYSNSFICACDCADSSCQVTINCAQCLWSGLAVEPGKSEDIVWSAMKSTMQTKMGTMGSFQCVAHAPIPTGAYRVSIQVYPTAADAASQANGKAVTKSFTLTTANATIDFPLL
jgi:hypothetical protein